MFILPHLCNLCHNCKTFLIYRNHGHGIDVDKALDGCDDQHATILLAHQPKAAKYALDTDRDIQLVLAGML